MEFLGTYNVIPSLPEKLENLRELAYNLYWTWNHDVISLFRRLDPDLWEQTYHNPVRFLGRIKQEKLSKAANDDGFIAHLNRTYERFREYMDSQTWFSKNHPDLNDLSVAYFSFEFGLTESLQTYSGGLGILAGDHLKSASDLGIPLVGIGVNFKDGYFQQFLTSDGWQRERYERSDFDNLPMRLVKDDNGKTKVVSVKFNGSEVLFQIWKIEVGRIPLYLLDTNISQNSAENRKLTQRLYGGDHETRIQQEIILGIGGIKTIHELGINPVVCHMNEGHSAFMALERIRHLVQESGLSFREAREVGMRTNIFTTHTPVPAGIDIFENKLVMKYLGNFVENELKISEEEFLALGNIDDGETDQGLFNMAHLAMNTAGYINGVSRLHGQVSRKMWSAGFKNIPVHEIPIDYVTNGVHVRSHLSPEMGEVITRYLGENWLEDQSDTELFKRIDDIPDEELWRTHERRRERLVAFARRRLLYQVKSRGGSEEEMKNASEVLNPSALTIGFARRFATYKRADLIFKDLERITDILTDPLKPVQIIIAGKAHPQDEEGKKLIQRIIEIAGSDELRKKIVFIENYDMNVARYMVEGCDIWLNNPRRPLEASGTSGMKVIANGGLNFSVLDGWWDEAYSSELGWKIGRGEEFLDNDYQDEIESRELYNTLEKEIVSLYYDRGDDNLPRKWITMMKNSIRDLTPVFNTSRMVKQYFDKFYVNAYHKRKQFSENDYQAARDAVAWKDKLISNWENIEVLKVNAGKKGSEIKVGDLYEVKADINLAGLTPDDVEVQLYFRQVEITDEQKNKNIVIMEVDNDNSSDGVYHYHGSISCESSGLFGYTIRILPKNGLMISPFELRKIFWARPVKK